VLGSGGCHLGAATATATALLAAIGAELASIAAEGCDAASVAAFACSQELLVSLIEASYAHNQQPRSVWLALWLEDWDQSAFVHQILQCHAHAQ
jgi:hypothetical protein